PSSTIQIVAARRSDVQLRVDVELGAPHREVSMNRTSCAIAAILALVFFPTRMFGIVQGHVDDFQDGTIDNWSDRHLDNTVNIPNGGPRGAGDNYLQLTSGPGGSARMAMINTGSWLNDFVAAGVTGLTMDLKNFGTSPLPIRIAIREASGGP